MHMAFIKKEFKPNRAESIGYCSISRHIVYSMQDVKKIVEKRECPPVV